MNEVLKALYDGCMETQAIEKSNFDIKQYRADLQCAYDCGYSAGKALLDKIRTEIEYIAKDYDKFEDLRRVRGLWIAIKIIDKYKAESEEKENDD